MRALAETGRLGSTLISISYAFRDPDDDGITSGMYVLLPYFHAIPHT